MCFIHTCPNVKSCMHSIDYDEEQPLLTDWVDLLTFSPNFFVILGILGMWLSRRDRQFSGQLEKTIRKKKKQWWTRLRILCVFLLREREKGFRFQVSGLRSVFPSLVFPLPPLVSYTQRCSFEASLMVAVTLCILYLIMYVLNPIKRNTHLNFDDHSLQWPFISLVKVIWIKLIFLTALLFTQIVNLL